MRITRANARFQQWQALLTNRTKRQRAGEFLVQGVRPISLAVEFGWPVHALIYDAERPLSSWAEQMLKAAGGERVAMAPELLRELGGKDEDVPELVAVVGLPADELSRIQVGPSLPGRRVRPAEQPRATSGRWRGRLDAFGGAGLIVTGHAADPYDPRVGAGVHRVAARRCRWCGCPSHREVLDWVARLRAQGMALTVVGTDESGTSDIAGLDLTGPTLLVIGNETTGLSAGWRQACDTMARIPIAGSASSLNAASAATVVLYEAARQRRGHTA